jgi:predicted protein tyrosine phosphatase
MEVFMWKDLNITIHSLEGIAHVVRSRKTDLNIVSIRSSDCPVDEYSFFEEHRCNYSSIIIEEFDDIEFSDGNLKLVSRAEIDSILRWAGEKGNIAVHCTAGISRSSAVAYLIACSRMPASEAVKVLNPNIHRPNALVVLKGISILRDRSIYDQYKKWLKAADEMTGMARLHSMTPFLKNSMTITEV